MSKECEQSSCPECGVERRDLLRHLQRQHDLTIDQARNRLGQSIEDRSIECPICNRKYSLVRGAILKHMVATHGMNLLEARKALGRVCKCGKPLPKPDRIYCSEECLGIARSEIARLRFTDKDDEQTRRRKQRYYATMDAKAGHSVSPAGITSWVESLGFEWIEPYRGTTNKIKLRCQQGHVFERVLQLFRDYPSCTVCNSIQRSSTIEKIQARISELGYRCKLDPNDFEYGIVPRSTVLNIECDQGHSYKAPCSYLMYTKQICPCCNKSKEEKEIADRLKALDVEIIQGDRTIAKPYEVDIVVPSANVAIEYCGLYWHSEKFRDSMYHRNKLDACNDAGYRLLTIFSDEWETKPEVCWDKILKAIHHPLEEIVADECELYPIDQMNASFFFEDFSLRGRCGITAAWALARSNQIVQCLALGNSSADTIELLRLTTRPGLSVVGGEERLIGEAAKWARRRILLRCDLRWEDHPEGFDPLRDEPPLCWRTYQRRQNYCRKDSSPKPRTRSRRTNRVWDCGYRVFAQDPR